jgi:hypothetical protein
MEATGYARWFERLLAELGFELWIGSPAEIKTKRVKKQKTDRKDAQLLLRRMREGAFPRIWIPRLPSHLGRGKLSVPELPSTIQGREDSGVARNCNSWRRVALCWGEWVGALRGVFEAIVLFVIFRSILSAIREPHASKAAAGLLAGIAAECFILALDKVMAIALSLSQVRDFIPVE